MIAWLGLGVACPSRHSKEQAEDIITECEKGDRVSHHPSIHSKKGLQWANIGHAPLQWTQITVHHANINDWVPGYTHLCSSPYPLTLLLPLENVDTIHYSKPIVLNYALIQVSLHICQRNVELKEPGVPGLYSATILKCRSTSAARERKDSTFLRAPNCFNLGAHVILVKRST